MESPEVAKLQKEIRSLKKQVERLEASRATFELMVDRNDKLLSRQLEQTQRQAEALNRINFLSDIALELTGCGYWHIDYSDPDHYHQSERSAKILGEPIKPDGRYHLQNEWFARLLEADPEVAKQTAERYQGAIEGRYENYQATYAYKRPADGNVVWIHALGKVVRDDEGHIRYMYGAYQDVTEARRVEVAIRTSQDRLRETEQFFRSVLELAPDGLMVVDSDGVIRLANVQCEKLFGYTRDELVGNKVEMLVPETLRERHPALRAGYHSAPSVRAMGKDRELLGMRKDGASLPIEIGLSPLPARDGDRASVAVSLRDVTERKEQETKLKQAKAKAEEATAAKGAFLANMSHEIRTPMNGIMGMTELALDTDLTAEQRDYLVTVKSSADALLSLINDILDFSKIEAGRIELDPIEFLLRDSIGDSLTPLALRAAAKGVELAYDIRPDVPDALIGDVYRLRQIIVNLAGNAIKFTDHGEVVITITQSERRDDKVTLEVAVRDTGIGIAPEAAARLFRAFEQAEMSTTRKYGGTGLGLAISKQLVELMGGQIRLESTPGVGSTFIFTVGFMVGTARSSASPEDAARVLKGRSALIVDDNQTNRRILTTMLGHWGLRTLEADSAKAALTALDRASSGGQTVSIVVTDLRMPEMDGFDLTRAIRAHPGFASLPVIMLTSSASTGDQAICAELGIAARLHKPVKQSLLLDNIMLVMGAADRSRAPAISRGATSEVTNAGLLPLRVLLAEDNPVNQKFAIRVLEGAGHTVVVANNGREAVERTGADSFDVVLMDVQMPEMDGLDATRAIRAREAVGGTRLPIIAMTANAMTGDREMCIAAGMDGYVAKPVKRDLLFAEVARVLNGGSHAGGT